MNNKIVLLYDIYGKLLTEKQRLYFEEYYFKNLSLSEISDTYKVSRNAIHKQLKVVEELLINYENILKINKKTELLNKIIENIKDEDLKNIISKLNDRM
ncbi:MAG: hypothetical protein GX032_04310 [Tenericutes bacterium]|nr:sigma factor-like helix-turn-helix DNA-binding protein [Bacilli bacterium]MDD3995416.1 sigma factor-like helix-turn-helix DNA-binding protein [Bacilli bacterium]MDD4623832.1 sigma factor-like helix-turn-helix DNA-binding protein [Bacilli bacterium]MDD4831903.1 sigma factor-like helix-turn-helix DNA-binding protein [Bacilli bacterium]NLV90673.1 hypothetical protein [Mycoplasmatota bacterium]